MPLYLLKSNIMQLLKKFRLLFFGLILLASWGQAQDTPVTIIKGSLKNYKSNILLVKYFENYVDYRKDSLEIDKDGNFSGKLTLKYPSYLDLQNGNTMIPAYISPGSKLEMEIDFSNRMTTCRGEDARANIFLLKGRNDPRIKPYHWSTTERASLEAFEKKFRTYFRIRGEILKEVFSQKELSEKERFFIKSEEWDMKAFQSWAFINYLDNQQKNNPDYQSLKKQHLNPELLAFEQTEKHLNARNLKYFYSSSLLSQYLRQVKDSLGNEAFQKLDYNSLVLSLIDKHYRGEVKRNMLLKRIKSRIDLLKNPQEIIAFLELKEEYQSYFTEEEKQKLAEKLRKRQKKLKNFVQGAPFPEFTFQNLEEKAFILDAKVLSQNRLNIIYPWASWCSPCIKSFPKLKEIENTFGDQVKLILISMDEEEGAFRSGLAKHQVPGLTLWAPGAFSSSFASYFEINAIPVQILVDQVGKIIDYNSIELSKEWVKSYLEK